MSNDKPLNKTKIEWCVNPDGTPGHVLNPIKGLCPFKCPYCYAAKIYNRFKLNPKLRFVPNELRRLNSIYGKDRTVFVGSTMDIFHDKIPSKWIRAILIEIDKNTTSKIIFLTKNPRRYREFTDYFRSNHWLGTSVTGPGDIGRVQLLKDLRTPASKFISFEPLIGPVFDADPTGIDWIICGPRTQPLTKPHKDWVEYIYMRACCPPVSPESSRMFMKRAMYAIYPEMREMRASYIPWVKR